MAMRQNRRSIRRARKATVNARKAARNERKAARSSTSRTPSRKPATRPNLPERTGQRKPATRPNLPDDPARKEARKKKNPHVDNPLGGLVMKQPGWGWTETKERRKAATTKRATTTKPSRTTKRATTTKPSRTTKPANNRRRGTEPKSNASNNYTPGSHKPAMRKGGMSSVRNKLNKMANSSNPFNRFTK